MEEGCPWAERTEELDACKGHPDENGRYKPFTKKKKTKSKQEKKKRYTTKFTDKDLCFDAVYDDF